MCPVWSCLLSLPTCGGCHFAHTAYVGSTSCLDVLWRRHADVLWTSGLDVRRTSVRCHLTTSHERHLHVFIGRRRTTSVYN